MSIVGLLLLCVIWAWTALRGDLLPAGVTGLRLSPFVADAALLGMFAALAGAGALTRKAAWPKGKELGWTALTGLGLFVVPALVTLRGEEWISASTRVALFSLTPVFTIVFEPYLGKDSPAIPRHGLAAALLAVVGTLLLFSIAIPRSPASGLAFVGLMVAAASVAAANCIGVRIVSCASGGSIFSFATVAAGCAAVGLCVCGAALPTQHGDAVHPDEWALLDLVATALLFWLMRRISAVRMTTRFLIAPLLASLAGLALLRPAVSFRDWAGLLLIALGSGWLLLTPEHETDIGQSLLLGSSTEHRPDP